MLQFKINNKKTEYIAKLKAELNNIRKEKEQIYSSAYSAI